jgi:hypothetical protein
MLILVGFWNANFLQDKGRTERVGKLGLYGLLAINIIGSKATGTAH